MEGGRLHTNTSLIAARYHDHESLRESSSIGMMRLRMWYVVEISQQLVLFFSGAREDAILAQKVTGSGQGRRPARNWLYMASDWLGGHCAWPSWVRLWHCLRSLTICAGSGGAGGTTDLVHKIPHVALRSKDKAQQKNLLNGDARLAMLPCAPALS